MSADDLTDAKLVQESESTIPPKNWSDFFDVVSVVGTTYQSIPCRNKGQASSLNWVIDEGFPTVWHGALTSFLAVIFKKHMQK